MYSLDLKTNCNLISASKLSVSRDVDLLRFKDELLKETSFLNTYGFVPLSLRYYCVINNILSIPKCICCCDKSTTYNKAYPSRGFVKYCSPECSRSDNTVPKDILEKLSNREWLYEQRIILKKTKGMIASEFGCSTVPITKWLKYHDIEHPRSDIKNIKEELPPKDILYEMYHIKNMTMLDISKEFNVSNTLIKTWMKYYDIELLDHSTTIKNKVIPKIKKSNKEKYGVEYAAQKHFSSEITDKLNDPEWLYQEHIINKKTLTEISNILDISDLTVKKYFDLYDIETKLYSFSGEENELSDFLSSFVSIERNNRKLISPKELDIYIPERNIAIEYNGCFWHSTQVNKNIYHQFEKYELCKKNNIRLITIYDDEWKYKKDIVKSKLKHLLYNSDDNKIYARNCSIILIDDNIKIKEFQNSTHIQGYARGSINIGLLYNSELVSIMTFKNNDFNYELSRYSTKYNVIGGFSKSLSYFLNNFEKKDIITFSDLRWHTGEVYIKYGFIEDKTLKPDYQYFFKHKRIHKFNFRHKQIKIKFPDLYNDQETEIQNMDRIGIPRIYDCGKIRYILKC